MSWTKPKLRKIESTLDTIAHCCEMEALKVKDQLKSIELLVQEMHRLPEEPDTDSKEQLRKDLLQLVAIAKRNAMLKIIKDSSRTEEVDSAMGELRD